MPCAPAGDPLAPSAASRARPAQRRRAPQRAAWSLALVFALLLGGVGAVAQDAPEVIVWTPASGAMLEAVRQEAATFTDAFDLEVDVTRLPAGELAVRMISDGPEGDGPDLVAWLPHADLSDLGREGVLADLRDTVTDAYLEETGPNARRALAPAGPVLALPMSVEGPALLYDRDVVDEPPTDYDALVQRAVELTGEGRYGFLVDATNFYFAYGWLRTFGGSLFAGANDGAADDGAREEGGAATPELGLTSPGAVRGLEALQALVHQHEVIPPDVDYATAHARFTAGDLAMFHTGPWAIPAAREAGIDVGAAPMPPLADGTPWTAFMEVRGVAISRFAEAPRDAANLAKWLSRPGAQAAYARRAGRVPAAPEALADLGEGHALAAFGQAMLHADPIPVVPAMGRVWGPMGRALARILREPATEVSRELARVAAQITGE